MMDDLFQDIERSTKNFEVPARHSKEIAWEMLNQKLETKPSFKSKVIKFNWVVGSLAAAAVFFAVMYLGMFNTGKYSPNVYSDIAKIETTYLPDSSKVILNSNSRYKYNFNKITGERNVVLNGEAFFDVEKGRKFTVDFHNNQVKVLGTSFNILAYNDQFMQIDCTSGLVEFTHNNITYSLSKGQSFKVFKQNITGPFSNDTERIRERLEGIYYWDKVSVDELLHLIGYRFGYSVSINEKIAKRNFSGKIDLANLRNGLTIVSYAMDLKYSIDENSKTIFINAK
ncbi:MAG: FecR family protein [Prolixibacteraceae bacterium]|jgi:transmembrane sensor|nr:FecR family protein [Prolixibacteraceae bacterium]